MPTTKEEYLAKTKSIGKDAAIALAKTRWWEGRPAWEVAMR